MLVSRDTMWSTGQLTKFADQMYAVRRRRPERRRCYLIPTAEVPLTAMHRDEILAGDALPLRYAAHTPCFRKEAGAAGKDTRGLIRQHQFEKVELVWLTHAGALVRRPRDADVRNAAGLLEELGIAHRVMLLCAGDTGFNAAKTYDLEVWLPGADAYREISSCSNCTDFQARRTNIRFRPRRDGEARARAHAQRLGPARSAARSRRSLENYQRADGGVDDPRGAAPFAGFASIEPDGSTRGRRDDDEVVARAVAVLRARRRRRDPDRDGVRARGRRRERRRDRARVRDQGPARATTR